MPGLGVQHCLVSFNADMESASRLLDEMFLLRISDARGRMHRIGARRQEMIACLALLRMHLAWEEFLESVFVRYMCGGRTATGHSPMLCAAPESTVGAAYKALLGGSSFLAWNTSNIDTRARHYFDHGEPFVTMLGSARNTLEQISVVRNRFAHRSEHAASHFRSLVRSVLGYTPRGMSPGRFLLAVDPANPGLRIIDTYASVLRVSARSIVP